MSTQQKVYELRTYVAVPGKIDALVERIGTHAAPLFEKHGMTSIGYWVQKDDAGAPTDNLVYLVAHDSVEAAAKSWEAFWADPDWTAARSSGEQVTASASAVFLDPTAFSPLR